MCCIIRFQGAQLLVNSFRVSELVIFEMGDDGTVVRVKVGANYIFPEGCGRIERLRCTWR